MKIIILLLAAASTSFSATGSWVPGAMVYTGKLPSVSCDVNSQICTATTELTMAFSGSGPAACNNQSQFSWYGRTPSGAVMTNMIEKAAAAGRTISVQIAPYCFAGNASVPTMLYYNIY